MKYSTSSWDPQVTPDEVANTSYVSYTLLRAVSTATYHSWWRRLRQDLGREKISHTHCCAGRADVGFMTLSRRGRRRLGGRVAHSRRARAARGGRLPARVRTRRRADPPAHRRVAAAGR